MLAIIYLLGTLIADLFKSQRRLEVENLFLRHQLNIILRRPAQRLRLRVSGPVSLSETPYSWRTGANRVMLLPDGPTAQIAL